MKLSDKSRTAIIAWLESMPWWEELPYAGLEEEKLRLRDTMLHAYMNLHGEALRKVGPILLADMENGK